MVKALNIDASHAVGETAAELWAFSQTLTQLSAAG